MPVEEELVDRMTSQQAEYANNAVLVSVVGVVVGSKYGRDDASKTAKRDILRTMAQ